MIKLKKNIIKCFIYLIMCFSIKWYWKSNLNLFNVIDLFYRKNLRFLMVFIVKGICNFFGMIKIMNIMEESV